VNGRKMPQIMPAAAVAAKREKCKKQKSKKKGRKPKTKQQNYMRRLRNFASPIFPPTPPKSLAVMHGVYATFDAAQCKFPSLANASHSALGEKTIHYRIRK